MKKLIFSIGLVLMLGISTQAQTTEGPKFIVDGFYGYPNIFTLLVNSASSGSNYSNRKHSVIGPLGITGEYMLNQQIGIGFEATYANNSLTYRYYDSGDNAYYNYKWIFTRYRILPRINVHFGKGSNVDPYLTLGVGYGKLNIKKEYDDPVANDLDLNLPSGTSFRLGFGIRYFFSEHVGAMAEFGVGGPLARFGVCGKF